jgi:pimeloyl-ACP methyl ester carboxylesterase
MQHLLLLHGAIGDKSQLIPLADSLQGKYIIHSVNFNGHGGQPFSDADFSIELFGNEVLKYLQENNIQNVSVFGYSMGGYVAMWLALRHPAGINKIITLGTKFYWDEAVAAKEVKMLDADTIQQKVPAFAEQLMKRHAPNDWRKLLDRTKVLLLQLGKKNALQLADYALLKVPCLLLLGDKDKMVTLKETEDVYKQLPNALMKILPDTAHAIEQVDVQVIAGKIEEFLTKK